MDPSNTPTMKTESAVALSHASSQTRLNWGDKMLTDWIRYFQQENETFTMRLLPAWRCCSYRRTCHKSTCHTWQWNRQGYHGGSSLGWSWCPVEGTRTSCRRFHPMDMTYVARPLEESMRHSCIQKAAGTYNTTFKFKWFNPYVMQEIKFKYLFYNEVILCPSDEYLCFAFACRNTFTSLCKAQEIAGKQSRRYILFW